jgi:hypothetical protein
MAPGYVIALALEAAGLLGLVLGTLRLRTERRARAAELRGLLLTGNATAASSSAVRTATSSAAPRRVVIVPTAAERGQDAFAARSALHRALGMYSQPARSAA